MDGLKIEDRITLDSAAAIADVESILDEMKGLRLDQQFAKFFGNRFAESLNGKERSIRDHLFDPFKVIVVGDFKRGKSTLINALLGEEVVPTAVTPETLTINQISYADVPRAEIVLQDNKRVYLEEGELKRDTLEGILTQLPAPARYLDVRNNAELLKEVTIIDTPGLGDLDNTFDAQISEYLVNADAILYVVSARAPLSYSEQAFLSSYVLPQSFSRIFLIVNMADFLETEENIGKIQKLTTDRVSLIGSPCSVFLLSALNEFCRKKDLKRPNPALADLLDRNFYEFESALRNDVILQKDIIKSTRVVTLTNDALDSLMNHMSLLKNSLENSAQERSRAKDDFNQRETERNAELEKHKQEVLSAIRDMRAEASTWMADFLEKIREELKRAQTKISTGDLERYLQFYLTDTVKDALMLCVERHQADIVDLLSTTAKAMANEIYTDTFGKINTQIAASIADISWTKVDSALFTGNVIVNLSGLSSIVGPLYLVAETIAGFVRQKMVSKQQKEYIAPVLMEYESLVSEVMCGVDEVYKKLSKNAVQTLDTLYEKQREAASEAYDQTQQIMLSENGLAEQASGYFEMVGANVARWKEALAKYR